MRVSVKCALIPRVLTFLAVAWSICDRISAIGITSDVGRALDRLANMPKPFSLVPGVRIVKREAPQRGTVVHHATVIDSAERMFQQHDLVLDAAPGIQMRVTATEDGRGFKLKAQPDDRPVARTFGVMRRLKLALLPIMYKLGVITTLLTLLTVFALKGLTIGVLLLMMGSVGLFSKLKGHHHEGWSSGAHKDVHVHVHGGGISHGYSSPAIYHSDSHWDRTGQMAARQPWNTQPQGASQGSPSWSPVRHHEDDRSPWDQFISR